MTHPVVVLRQAYIGWGHTPVDMFCVKYVSSAGERMMLIISFVVVVSCLMLVVAVVAVYCRQRYRRKPAAAADDVEDESERYVEANSGQPASNSLRGVDGNVRVNFQSEPFGDEDDGDDDIR